MPGILQGRRVLIVGAASQRSIAYGVAKAMRDQGADLAFTYQNERLKPRVEAMANDLGSDLLFPCDVADDDAIAAVFDQLKTTWPQLDGLVHSVAFAPAEQLTGSYIDAIDRQGFQTAHDISSFSLCALTKAAWDRKMLADGSHVLTLSYIGAMRAIPCYNVMGVAKASLEANVRYLAQSLGPHGVRVNAVSAGPIKTLAAAGIKQFKHMLDLSARTTPLQRNVTIDEVGQTAAFLTSSMASGITGEVLHVDAGFHCVGMPGLTETS